MDKRGLVECCARACEAALYEEAEALALGDLEVAADAADAAAFWAERAMAIATEPKPVHVRARDDLA